MKFGDCEVKWWQHLLMGVFGPLLGGLYGVTGLMMCGMGMNNFAPHWYNRWWSYLLGLIIGLFGAHTIDSLFYNGEYCLQEWQTSFGITIPKLSRKKKR